MGNCEMQNKLHQNHV